MPAAHEQRRKDLAKIHLAKKQLGLDDEAYRDVLWTIARVRSAADLDDAGRRRVLDHFRSRGFKPRRRGRSTPASDRDLLIRKIRAQLGDRPDAYADGMAKKMFHVERFEWLKPEQLQKMVAALNYDAKRRNKR